MKAMGHHIDNGNSGLLGIVSTIGLYVISRLTVQEWASFATIFAAVCTGIYYIKKTFFDKK